MKNMMNFRRCSRLPLSCVMAASIAIAGCSGDQLGDTNGGFAAGANTATVLGVVGGVVLAGALLASDDDDNDGAAVGGTDDGTTDGGATGGGTDDGTTDGGATGGGTDDGTTGGGATGGGTDDGTTGGGATGGGTDDGTTDGGATGGGTDDGTTDGGATGGGTDDGTTGGTTTGGTTTGGTTGGGTTGGGTTGDGSNTGPVTLGGLGAFVTNLLPEEAIPASTSGGSADASLSFNRDTGFATGDVELSGITVDGDTRVDIMVGPPGSNGFVAVELEMTGPNTWSLPQVLSMEQTDFVAQNINSGNLYVAVRTAEFPNGAFRRQIVPSGVSRFTTTDTGTTGGSAEGFLMVNRESGDYNITWNTTGAEALATAHVNDGVISGNAENNLFSLSQRESNLEQFFGFGNFMNVNDPLADLITRLESDQGLWLDAHAVSDDSRVFFSQLLPDSF
jgi:hypothetical protein